MKKTFESFPWSDYGNPIGVDEVGRGCLAGPVYAAAAILGSNAPLEEFTDSKAISEKRREKLIDVILESCFVGIGFASVEEIDQINILQASLLAMKRAIENLPEAERKGKIVLVDGNQKIPKLEGHEQVTVVKGDLRAAPIGAASIVAKVTRDRLMKELDDQYPGYGLANHKGYSTKSHKEAVAALGPVAVHRKTFRGVKEHLPGYQAGLSL